MDDTCVQNYRSLHAQANAVTAIETPSADYRSFTFDLVFANQTMPPALPQRTVTGEMIGSVTDVDDPAFEAGDGAPQWKTVCRIVTRSGN